MLDSLPNDVFFEIVSLLPVKAIIRCMCVSKTCCSHISSPDFIATHRNRSLSNPKHPPYLLYHADGELMKARFTLHPSDGPFSSTNFTELRSSHQNIDQLSVAVGSSNGLVCLADNFLGSARYVLWNPSIQKGITLPDLDDEFGCDLYQTSLGFGYLPKTDDPRIDDYKLVRLVFLHPDPQDFEYGIPNWVQIYTFRDQAWRTVGFNGPPCFMKIGVSATFLHGALHWQAHLGHDNGEWRHVIVSFDLEGEGFHEVGMPESLQEKGYPSDMAVLDGQLALVLGPYPRWKPKTVWVMKEYGVVKSWAKLFDIEMFPLSRVIGFKDFKDSKDFKDFKETDEVLLDNFGCLFSYQPKNQRRVSLPFCDQGRSSLLTNMYRVLSC